MADDRPFIEHVRKQERERTLQFVYTEIEKRIKAHGVSSFAATALTEVNEFISWNMDPDGDGIVRKKQMLAMSLELAEMTRSLLNICRLVDELSDPQKTPDETETIRLNLIMRVDLALNNYGRKK